MEKSLTEDWDSTATSHDLYTRLALKHHLVKRPAKVITVSHLTMSTSQPALNALSWSRTYLSTTNCCGPYYGLTRLIEENLTRWCVIWRIYSDSDVFWCINKLQGTAKLVVMTYLKNHTTGRKKTKLINTDDGKCKSVMRLVPRKPSCINTN